MSLPLPSMLADMGTSGRPITEDHSPAEPPVAGGAPSNVQAWLTPPLQVHCTSCRPASVLEFGTSRHLPLRRDFRVQADPVQVGIQTWFVPVWQVYCVISAPFSALAPETSMHCPLCRTAIR